MGVQVTPPPAALMPHLHSLIRLAGTGWAGLSRADLSHHDCCWAYLIGDGQVTIVLGPPHSVGIRFLSNPQQGRANISLVAPGQRIELRSRDFGEDQVSNHALPPLTRRARLAGGMSER